MHMRMWEEEAARVTTLGGGRAREKSKHAGCSSWALEAPIEGAGCLLATRVERRRTSTGLIIDIRSARLAVAGLPSLSETHGARACRAR